MQDNRNKNRRHSNSKSRPNGRETIEDILPSSQILEKFEDAIPGSVDKLIKMAQQEQEHRQEPDMTSKTKAAAVVVVIETVTRTHDK